MYTITKEAAMRLIAKALDDQNKRNICYEAGHALSDNQKEQYEQVQWLRDAMLCGEIDITYTEREGTQKQTTVVWEG